MSVRVEPLQVKGIKQALAELNSIDKKLRRSFTVEYKTIVQPMVDEAQYLVPVRAPMSGWNRSWTPRNSRRPIGANNVLPWGGNEQRAIKPYLSGKRPRTVGGTTRNLAAFGMKWTSRNAVLFDAAGQARTPQGEQMLDTLGQRYGSPSRAMWRAYEQSGPDIQYEIRQLVEKIMNAVGRNIKVVE